MTFHEKINNLSWRPRGEAKEAYDDFMRNPDYSNPENLEKLLICLTYEKQYDTAISLAKTLMEKYKVSDRPFLYFFYAISCDMTNQREPAFAVYKEILKLDEIPTNMFTQFGIEYFCKEFIEYLCEHPFSQQNVDKFDFSICKYAFEHKLQKILSVVKSQHFYIYYYPNSTAEKEIDHIVSQREQAYRNIKEYLGYSGDLTVDLYLFEDADKKTEITGHTGAGWAFGTSMVEIYNDAVKVDPYHELVHVIAGVAYGSTVSTLNEGLAVYMCNLLGDDPSLDEINGAYSDFVKQFHRDNELFTIEKLLSLQIGTIESKPRISYRQAASFVEFMIKKLGKERFFSLYQSTKPDYSPSGIAANISAIEIAYGKKIESIEKEWLGSLA